MYSHGAGKFRMWYAWFEGFLQDADGKGIGGMVEARMWRMYL